MLQLFWDSLVLFPVQVLILILCIPVGLAVLFIKEPKVQEDLRARGKDPQEMSTKIHKNWDILTTFEAFLLVLSLLKMAYTVGVAKGMF